MTGDPKRKKEVYLEGPNRLGISRRGEKRHLVGERACARSNPTKKKKKSVDNVTCGGERKEGIPRRKEKKV